MKPLSSLEVGQVSACAKQRGLPLDFMLAALRARNATPRTLRLVRAVRRLELGGKVPGRLGEMASEWVRWIDSIARRTKTAKK